MSSSREGGRLHHDWACEQQGEAAGGVVGGGEFPQTQRTYMMTDSRT